MTLYCATHKDENLNALRGERLDAMTEHMVMHKSYSLGAISFVSPKYVIWEMKMDSEGKFYFNNIVDRA